MILHGHLDVVPAREGQFEPRVEGDRLIGRGAYDMKGALAVDDVRDRDAAEQDRVRVRLLCVPDEESEDVDNRSTDALVAEGLRADFALTGEPTDLHIGVQAKGVLAVRVEVQGTGAHGSTPWLGDNAILKAHDVFRRIETLPFSRESSDLFDRPSINLARIEGGDAFNKVPDVCTMDVDIRFLPNQDPGEILGPDPGDRRPRDRQDVHPRAGDRLAPQPLRPRPARRGRALDRGRGALRRPRRRVRRDLVPGGRRPRRRVRARSAAATTARTSGSRSPRWPATAEALGDFVVALPVWLAPRQDPPLRASTAGWREAAVPRPAPAGGAPAAPGALDARPRAPWARWSSSCCRPRPVASAVLLEVNEAVQIFQHESMPLDPGVKELLADVAPGKPQTILVIGDDRRYDEVYDRKGKLLNTRRGRGRTR